MLSKSERRQQAREKEREERSDNDGFIVARKIKKTQAELRSLLHGAPKAVKNVLASEYGSAMRPKDYEESAWFAGYSGDVGEFLTVKDGGFSLDTPSDRAQSTPFYIACAMGQTAMVEYIASTPGLADLNAQNRTGATGFFAAAQCGHAKLVRYLAGKRKGEDFAIDIELPDDNGITPFDMAQANGDHAVLHELKFARQVRVEVRAPTLSPGTSRDNSQRGSRASSREGGALGGGARGGGGRRWGAPGVQARV